MISQSARLRHRNASAARGQVPPGQDAADAAVAASTTGAASTTPSAASTTPGSADEQAPRLSVGRQAGAAVLGAATTLALSLLAAALLSFVVKAAG